MTGSDWFVVLVLFGLLAIVVGLDLAIRREQHRARRRERRRLLDEIKRHP